jgi:hypothetical protein
MFHHAYICAVTSPGQKISHAKGGQDGRAISSASTTFRPTSAFTGASAFFTIALANYFISGGSTA